MNIRIGQYSSLQKLRHKEDMEIEEIREVTLLRGEHFSYEIGVWTDDFAFSTLVTGLYREGLPLEDAFIRTYIIENAVMDFPIYQDHDEDILTDEPGFMPDILIPTTERAILANRTEPASFLVELNIPADFPAGTYELRSSVFTGEANKDIREENERSLRIHVLPMRVPEQSVHFTQWFHVDSIAEAYRVPIYSEAHWELIGKYMETARYCGIDTILTPALTPALDTKIGTRRPHVQLVKIEKRGEDYNFDFNLLGRFIDLALSKGMKQFEISHFFSQWGLNCPPNILVSVEGKEEWLFGWGMDGHGEVYYAFLRQYVPALVDYLEKRGVLDRCLFHISDEPSTEALPNYRKAHDLVKPMLKGRPLMDALSNIEFYREGILDIPVTASNHMGPFLAENIETQWTYYCCGQHKQVGNRFLCFPAYRNRILGLQLYKFNIKGFLQWGFNFYHGCVSGYYLNPFISTSADGAFPAGDPFSVYPGPDGPWYTLRALVFKDALQDVAVLKLAEERLGREKVVSMIDEAAGFPLTFEDYPRNSEYIPMLMESIKKEMN